MDDTVDQPPGLFVTATDTEVGKTWVTSSIARICTQRGLRVGVYKPVASGVDSEKMDQSDPYLLWEAAGRPLTPQQVCPQCFEAAVAPGVAAKQRDQTVDEDLLFEGIRPWMDFEFVLVEGVGGLMSPVSDSLYVADLALKLGWPVLVVAPNRLGVINATLQTLITASVYQEGLDVVGVVLNDVDAKGDLSAATNKSELERRSVPPLLAHVTHGSGDALSKLDWLALAKEARL